MYISRQRPGVQCEVLLLGRPDACGWITMCPKKCRLPGSDFIMLSVRISRRLYYSTCTDYAAFAIGWGWHKDIPLFSSIPSAEERGSLSGRNV